MRFSADSSHNSFSLSGSSGMCHLHPRDLFFKKVASSHWNNFFCFCLEFCFAISRRPTALIIFKPRYTQLTIDLIKNFVLCILILDSKWSNYRLPKWQKFWIYLYESEERFNNFIKTSNSVLSLFRVEMRLLPDYNDYTPRKCGRKHFLFLRASGEEPLIFQIIVENEMKAVYKIQKSVVI